MKLSQLLTGRLISHDERMRFCGGNLVGLVATVREVESKKEVTKGLLALARPLYRLFSGFEVRSLSS